VAGERSRSQLTLLRVFARQNETLLISGPSGVGKSRLAHWCHTHSPRATGPYQVVDLLSVPEEMQMAELFGWRRGAFTGAHQDQEGCISRSQGGTLFIDEIDKLSLKAQAGLLQLLETSCYRVLGDPGRQREADVRFIVATNADLKAKVALGQFREDLYFRINVLPFRLAPLAERSDEIVPWAEFMLRRRHQDSRLEGGVQLSAAAARLIEQAEWPGNLRQLDNVLRRAYAMALAEECHGGVRVEEHHIEAAVRLDGTPAAPCLMMGLRKLAEQFIEHALRCKEGGGELPLEHADALRGLVLEAGVRRLGDVREVYRLLGAEAVVRSRNHSREYRRELEKVSLLEAAVGTPPLPTL
jgi:DNA-binding NtrC family response regulator